MTTTSIAGTAGLMTLPEIKERAKGKWAQIFDTLAPNSRPALDNAPYHVPCPVHGGENGFRFFEHFNDTGRCVCNTCGAKKSGIETLQWLKANALDPSLRVTGYTFDDAASEVANWLRKGQAAPARVRPPPVLPVRKMDPELAFEKIQKVLQESTPISGTAAERYLINRGLWPENIPDTLRAHPSLPYFDVQTKTMLGYFPCLLAPITNKEGSLVSVHRIYVTPEGVQAPVPSPKKMMNACGEIRGAAIKLYQPGNVLGLSEGLETGLAVRAISRMPVWSCVTAGLLEVVDLPDEVEHCVIWADLDRSKRGEEAAEALADRVVNSGRTAKIHFPFVSIPPNSKGVDWLDVLLTQGVNGFPAKWRRWRASPLGVKYD